MKITPPAFFCKKTAKTVATFVAIAACCITGHFSRAQQLPSFEENWVEDNPGGSELPQDDWIQTKQSILDTDGNIYYASTVTVGGEKKIQVTKRNMSGTLVWQETYEPTVHETYTNVTFKGIAQDYDGYFYIAGDAYATNSSSNDIMYWKIDLNGTVVFENVHSLTGNQLIMDVEKPIQSDQFIVLFQEGNNTKVTAFENDGTGDNWTYPKWSANGVKLTSYGQTVYFSSFTWGGNYHVDAVDVNTGALSWSQSLARGLNAGFLHSIPTGLAADITGIYVGVTKEDRVIPGEKGVNYLEVTKMYQSNRPLIGKLKGDVAWSTKIFEAYPPGVDKVNYFDFNWQNGPQLVMNNHRFPTISCGFFNGFDRLGNGDFNGITTVTLHPTAGSVYMRHNYFKENADRDFYPRVVGIAVDVNNNLAVNAKFGIPQNGTGTYRASKTIVVSSNGLLLGDLDYDMSVSEGYEMADRTYNIHAKLVKACDVGSSPCATCPINLDPTTESVFYVTGPSLCWQLQLTTPCTDLDQVTISQNSENMPITEEADTELASGLLHSVYPNPAKSQIVIDLEDSHTGTLNLRILDIFGKVKYTAIVRDGAMIDLENMSLPPGHYMVEVSDDNKSEKRSLIIE